MCVYCNVWRMDMDIAACRLWLTLRDWSITVVFLISLYRKVYVGVCSLVLWLLCKYNSVRIAHYVRITLCYTILSNNHFARYATRCLSGSFWTLYLRRQSTSNTRTHLVTVARAWDSLPTSITALISLPSSKRQLETFLFIKSFPSV